MEFRPECGRCHVSLAPEASAYFCAFECTFCPTCFLRLRFICPNCNGELVRRPRRTPRSPPGSLTSLIPDPRVTVRRATLEDLDKVAPLFDSYRQFYQQEPALTAGRRFLAERLSRDESVILVAEARDVAVGFVLLYPSFTSISLGPIYVLNDLFVSMKSRRTGVGTLLLGAARAYGQRNGAHYLELSTGVDNPAQRLYETSGWNLDRESLHYELPLRSHSGTGEHLERPENGG